MVCVVNSRPVKIKPKEEENEPKKEENQEAEEEVTLQM